MADRSAIDPGPEGIPGYRAWAPPPRGGQRPAARQPYDLSQPFDPETLKSGFIEEDRVVHAEDDPVLAEMAQRAQQARDRFLAEHQDDDEAP